MTSMTYSLYALPHSLYSGRARSYLIKNGIAYREVSCGHESFKTDVVPKAKLPTIPAMLTPDGHVIRDGAAIIEYFEAANGRPCQPKTPKQQLVSGLFDLIGNEGYCARPCITDGISLNRICHFCTTIFIMPSRSTQSARPKPTI